MRTLSSTLLAEQQAASHTPSVKVEVKNKMTGVIRLTWERLYQGTESEYWHSLALAGDGALIRVRISLLSDGNKLYRQRVANPGEQSDFSTWTYTGQYNCAAVAAAAHGSEVSIFWINSSREIRRLKSNDTGITWNSPELLDYAVSVNIHGMTAAYKPNGDAAIFFADQTAVWLKKCINGVWQAKSIWDKTSGTISSVSAVYTGDWRLMVTAQDTDTSYKVWSLIFGDGGEVPVNMWSALKEVASAPAGGDYEYNAIFADKPDVLRVFYVEKFKGTQNYSRPFWTYALPVDGFTDSFWREPAPINLTSQYGVALAHCGDYCWLSCANGVWRASLVEASLDLTGDIISLRQELAPQNSRLLVELKNDENKYQQGGTGSLAVLQLGAQIEISPGFVTPQGIENSPGVIFWLEGTEQLSAPGTSSFSLSGVDGWNLLSNWRARHQFRWNKDTGDVPVKQMLAFVLARAGLQLEAESQSAVITSFFPDFTIQPGDSGGDIVRRLLSFVPDLLFFEGAKAWLVNPQTTDGTVYFYGQHHPIFQGKYYSGSWQLNQTRVEGYNPVGGAPVVTDNFNWEQLDYFNDRTKLIIDRNINSATAGQALAGAVLRKMEIESAGGMIRIPINCGQQLFDVIEIDDRRAGLTGLKRRVVGITLNYEPVRGLYEQTILLGGV